MRTNSIISDPEPTTPQPTAKPQEKNEPQNDFDKLANSDDYPQFKEYIEQRIKYFQGYLPSTGEPVEKLSDEQRAVAWGQSAVAIKELEMLNQTVQNFKRKK